jgi:hypothetical protein
MWNWLPWGGTFSWSPSRGSPSLSSSSHPSLRSTSQSSTLATTLVDLCASSRTNLSPSSRCTDLPQLDASPTTLSRSTSGVASLHLSSCQSRPQPSRLMCQTHASNLPSSTRHPPSVCLSRTWPCEMSSASLSTRSRASTPTLSPCSSDLPSCTSSLRTQH